MPQVIFGLLFALEAVGYFLHGLGRLMILAYYVFVLFMVFSSTRVTKVLLDDERGQVHSNVIGENVYGVDVIEKKKRMIVLFRNIMVVYCVIQFAVSVACLALFLSLSLFLARTRKPLLFFHQSSLFTNLLFLSLSLSMSLSLCLSLSLSLDLSLPSALFQVPPQATAYAKSS